MHHPKRILLKHVGNLGDHLFLVGALLEGLKRVWPTAEVTLVATWGYKDASGRWGKRNQDGYCITLMMRHPHVRQLIHWSDTDCAPSGGICVEAGHSFPTWNRSYFEAQRAHFDLTAELDTGLEIEENPLDRMAEAVGLPKLKLGPYRLLLTDEESAVGAEIMKRYPHPRVALLEGLNGPTMRGWDPAKVVVLSDLLALRGVMPFWWGANSAPLYRGRALNLREHLAVLAQSDLAIGVMGAPMHFAAAVGVQTICLYGAQSYHRAAPGYFFNPEISDSKLHHVTLFGPTCDEPCFLKRDIPCKNLRSGDRINTNFQSWQAPGRQSDKSCVATINPELVYAAASEVLERRGW